MRHDTIASFLQKKFWPKFSLTGVLHPGDDNTHMQINVTLHTSLYTCRQYTVNSPVPIHGSCKRSFVKMPIRSQNADLDKL